MSSGTRRPTGYGTEMEAFEAALSGSDEETPEAVAVLSEPFGVREQFLDYAEASVEKQVTRVKCSPASSPASPPELGDTDVVLVDDCQHLFVRQIGGFAELDRFLRQVATFDGLVVTSWNSFAWDYLVAVKDLERTFPTQIRLGRLDSEQIRTLLLDEDGEDAPDLVDDRESTVEPLVVRRERPVSLGRDRTVRLPYATLNVGELFRRGTLNVGELFRRGTLHDGENGEVVVFDRITQYANGNPGVARSLWDQSRSDGRIELSAIREPDHELGVDYDTAFLLQVLLTKERISYDELHSVVEHPDIDRALGQLAKKDVLRVEDDTVVLRPDALKPLIESLERRRIIW